MARSLGLLACLVAQLGWLDGASGGLPYTVRQIVNADDVEHRMLRDGFHFGTLIEDDFGRLIFRPHPDRDDPDGWGTSLFLTPFLSGADAGGGAVDAISATEEGIRFSTSGSINAPTGETFGSFAWDLRFEFDSVEERATAAGSMTVDLDAPLSAAGVDLSLNRISSNILVDVDLLSGGRGITGDMVVADARFGERGEEHRFGWHPPRQQATFPLERSHVLAINTIGDVNESVVFATPVRKPSVELTLRETSDARVLSFGGFFDRRVAQDPDADNVGINHLILQNSTDATHFEFDVAIDSVPPIDSLPGDYNFNGVVEQADLDLVLLNWGFRDRHVPAGWLNDMPNDAVDQEELDRVLLEWGESVSSFLGGSAAISGAASVPEPTGFLLAIYAVLAAVSARLSLL